SDVCSSDLGHLVEKDKLMKAVWPDSFVEEANLTVNISALRKALGDQPSGRPYIETVTKRGYRFAISVRQIEIPPSEPKEYPASLPKLSNRLTRCNKCRRPLPSSPPSNRQ